MNIEICHVYWFVHLKKKPLVTLGFIRSSKGSAFVIGGTTGSHFTGHGESFWDKYKEIISLGYVPVEVAKDLGQLSSEWKPPDLSPPDKEDVESILNKEL